MHPQDPVLGQPMPKKTKNAKERRKLKRHNLIANVMNQNIPLYPSVQELSFDHSDQCQVHPLI